MIAESSTATPSFEATNTAPVPSQNRTNRPLVVVLMEILNDEVATDAIWWLPGGKAFAVDPDVTPSKILNVYFNGTKIASFVRQLNNA